MLKQVIIVRKDLKMSEGKLAAQACHASVEAVLKSDFELVGRWRREGAKKIVLEVKSEKELLELKAQAAKAKLICSLIADAGMTELKPGTKTALGIGPDDEKKIDKITGSLKAL